MNTASTLGNGTEGPARWSLRLLGGFELAVLPGGARVTSLGKRERLLLAYLAVSPNSRQPRRKVATLLWGDANDETLLNNVRGCIWKLRKALGDSKHRVVASEGDDIVLDAAAFEVDALAFCRLAAQSSRTDLEAAAELYAGEFLDGLVIESEEFESWRRAEAMRYEDQTLDALNRLMTLLSACGETERATETAERILRLEPLHEAALRRLMRLYGESGRRGAAVQLYRTFSDALRTELDAQPEAETRAVFAEITRGGEEQANGHAAAEAKPPPPSTSMARSSEGPRGSHRRPEQQVAPWRAHAGKRKAGKLGWILAGGLAAVVAISLYYEVPATGTTTAQRSAELETAKTDASRARVISIAVLPFANLSGDAMQEFFSDGLTEEITAALARVPNLRVVGRTSAFQFKGHTTDLAAIRRALGVRYLIDGSVRKEGTRVRITAQLVEASSGLNLWTESYDRQLTSVFATQEDIAQAIADALRVPLGLKPGETLITSRIADTEIYEQ